jgi:hypothetical protein
MTALRFLYIEWFPTHLLLSLHYHPSVNDMRSYLSSERTRRLSLSSHSLHPLSDLLVDLHISFVNSISTVRSSLPQRTWMYIYRYRLPLLLGVHLHDTGERHLGRYISCDMIRLDGCYLSAFHLLREHPTAA